VDYEELANRTDLALLPVGAVEVYGPHMPMGCDGIVSLDLARAAAEKVEALVVPLVPVGYSLSLQSFPGTLTVSPEALKEYLYDVCLSLVKWGARRLMFINGHLGNVGPVRELCDALSEENEELRCAQIDLWRFIQPRSEGVLDSKEWPFGHAGEAMTSVMLHLHPELVKVERAAKTLPEKKDEWPDFIKVRSYRDLSRDGILGDAALATAEKGEIIFSRCVDRLAAFLQSPDFQ